MKRVVVIGGSGFFGRLIVERLKAAGLEPISASRSSGEMRLDVDNPADLKANLKQRDLVIDTAGPFQKRSQALIDAARTIGFDVIDLSDSPDYTAKVYEREAPIGAAGIRVLTACSALSTVSALMLASTGIEQPRRLSVYLRPASRHTANPATVLSFLNSIEGHWRVFRFGQTLGNRYGITVRSVDSVTLPRIFDSLHSTELVVDTGSTIANALLRYKAVRRLVERHHARAIQIERRTGVSQGVVAYEIVSTQRQRQHIFTGPNTYMLAVIPAVEAAIAIANGRFPRRGLIPPTEHVGATEFLEAVKKEGIEVERRAVR